jgi:hypothetical protein
LSREVPHLQLISTWAARGNTDAVNVHPFEYICGEYNHLLAVMLVPCHAAAALAFVVVGGVLASLNHTRFEVPSPQPHSRSWWWAACWRRSTTRGSRYPAPNPTWGVRPSTDAKVAHRPTFGISGGRIVHAAVSRRPPISLYRTVARTHMYAAKVWDFSIVQRTNSIAPCQTLIVRFATLASL